MLENFELPTSAKTYFQSHGWIEGATGFRHLRFPILRTFHPDHSVYSRYVNHGLAGIWLQARSPFRTLRLLAIALRDLHAELRLLTTIAEEDWLSKEISDARNSAISRQLEGLGRGEVLLVSIFILLRRLADDLMDSLRPVLFEDWQCAPRKLTTASASAQSDGLHLLKPYYDADVLSAVLCTNVAWLEKLRKEEGIRDILVHRPHILSVNPHGTKPADNKNFRWHTSATMTSFTKGDIQTVILFPLLLDCLAGACEFMTSISRLIGGMDDYHQRDMMLLTGSDNDVVGFWPAIESSRREFPLLD